MNIFSFNLSDVSTKAYKKNIFFSGHWFVDKNHFFAVANTKESRKDEKYRCFLKNRDDDLYIGASITPECHTLKTVEKSPERYRINPVKVSFFCLFIQIKHMYFVFIIIIERKILEY